MKHKITIPLIIFTTIFSWFSWLPIKVQAASPVLITEVQTGFIDGNGTEFPKQEFIELTNVTAAAVNMTGWRIDYLSAANDGSAGPTAVIDNLSSQISGNGHGIWEHEGYYPIPPDSIFGFGDNSSTGFLAKTGGHVRLMNGSTMIDCVSWGSAVAITGCDKVASPAPAGYTLQRKMLNGVYDKSAGVANLKPATPQGGNIYSPNVTTTPAPTTPPAPTSPEPTCANIELSEILANPAGDDAQGEFIEIYNPTNQSQELYGCSIQLANGKKFSFAANDVILANSYLSLPYTVTSLQLSNSGGTVSLITVSNQTSTDYPTVSDDQAWALIDGVWQITNQATPGARNILVLPNIITDQSVVTISDGLEACPAGKFRNPETGRCKNIVIETVAAACGVGQERNPDTGRCRKIVTTTVVPCQPDQTRNPDTGRCRKNDVVSSAVKPCDPGQERNPDTGRCRKQVQTTKVLGDSTKHAPNYYNWLAIVIVASLAISYGIYEYRNDLKNLWFRLRRRTVN